jgi:hypothetical protein
MEIPAMASTSGGVIKRATTGSVRASTASSLSTTVSSLPLEVQLPKQGAHTGAFVGRQRLHRRPVPARLAEQIRHRRGRGQVAGQDRMNLISSWFVAGPGERGG